MRSAVSVLIGSMLAAAPVMAATPASKLIGKPAPAYELTLTDGTKVDSASLRGEVVVLNFWATWCVPCRKELPTLDTYYAIAAEKGWGLKVFAVATEDSVPEFKLKKLFAVLHLKPARRIKGETYGPIDGAVPTNIVIDRAGVIRYAKAGAFDLDALNTILVPLLREPRPTT
jgi:cytochrome c biogenesis protein CcmG, thiol:disulfide interchange protein DsbE